MAEKHFVSNPDTRHDILLDRGMGRDKAARLAATDVRTAPETYEDWTDEELYRRAGEVGVEDRFGMGRNELIAAIRAGLH